MVDPREGATLQTNVSLKFCRLSQLSNTSDRIIHCLHQYINGSAFLRMFKTMIYHLVHFFPYKHMYRLFIAKTKNIL